MVTETRWTWSDILFAALFGIGILSYPLFQIFDQESFQLFFVLALIRTAAAVAGIIKGKLWRDKGFLLMIGLMLYQIIGIAFKNRDLFFSESVSRYLFNGFWAIGGCYALGRVYSGEKLEGILRCFLGCWTIMLVGNCIVAMVAAWTDQTVWNASHNSAWGISEYGRLFVGNIFPTVAGSNLSAGGVAALIGLLAEKDKRIKAAYAVSFLIFIVTLSLTDARSSILSLASGVGVSAGIILVRKMGKNREAETRKRKAFVWAMAAVSSILVMAAATLVILQIAPAFNSMKTKGLTVTTAYAEEEQPGEPESHLIKSRGFTGSRLLSGRETIWKEAYLCLAENPRRLLFGYSIHEPMSEINRRTGLRGYEPKGHCHNIGLQIIVESGIIGFLIAAGFLVYLIILSIRIINDHDSPAWQYFLPIIIISAIIGDLADCFCWFGSWTCLVLPLFFVSAGLISTAGKNSKYGNHCKTG